MTNLKKIITVVVIAFFVYRGLGSGILAEEAVPVDQTTPPVADILTETPTPSPTEDVTIDSSAQVTSDVSSTGNSGDNQIVVEPTPTPEETVPLVLSEPVASTEEAVLSEGEEATPSALPETDNSQTQSAETSSGGGSESSVQTGDAVSVTEVENDINSTQANSRVLRQTLNIFVNNAADIDLSVTPLAIAQKVFEEEGSEADMVNVQMLDINNFAYLTNNITSLASSGTNIIDGGGDTRIYTGDAYSVVSLLNMVDTTIVNSTIHLVTINIFGNTQGNIILPEFSVGDIRSCCSGSIGIQNNALVLNNVSAEAVSGENSANVSGEATITTGNAESIVSVYNLVNANIINSVFYRLFINTVGEWNGDFLGWLNESFQAGGGSLSFESAGSGNAGACDGCFNGVDIQNRAIISNNISSSAVSGRNTADGTTAEIDTGNAYSIVSLANFINSSIINSWGFIGYINIFGSLLGDIGGESMFAPPPEPEAQISSSEDQPFVREQGGLLGVNHTNNVGQYVLPGDTVTFFVNVKNPGTGIVYDTRVLVELIKDGVVGGGGYFNAGDIHPHRGVKMSFGLVLSDSAPGGNYTARVSAIGVVGPGENQVSAYSSSNFLIRALSAFVSGISGEAEASPVQGVLAAANPGPSREQVLTLIFFGLLLTYVLGKSYQKRRQIVAFVYRNRRYFGPAAAIGIRAFLLRIGHLL